MFSRSGLLTTMTVVALVVAAPAPAPAQRATMTVIDGSLQPRDQSTVLLAVSAGALGLANMVSNPTGASRAMSYVGVGVGAVAIFAGVRTEAEADGSGRPSEARAAIVAGTASSVISVFTLLPRRGQQPSSNRISLSPVIRVPRAQPPRVGLSGQLRF